MFIYLSMPMLTTALLILPDAQLDGRIVSISFLSLQSLVWRPASCICAGALCRPKTVGYGRICFSICPVMAVGYLGGIVSGGQRPHDLP